MIDLDEGFRGSQRLQAGGAASGYRLQIAAPISPCHQGTMLQHPLKQNADSTKCRILDKAPQFGPFAQGTAF